MNDQRFSIAAFLVLLALASAAHGDAYRFEMVIFERPNAVTNEVSVEEPGEMDLGLSRGRLDALAVGGDRLGGVAYTLRKKGMIVHEHVAWVQKPGGRSSQAWYRVGDGRLSGLIRVTRGRFLHVDADLLLQDANAAQPMRARLYRRMRSDELHYMDHPRMGIIIRADRLKPRAQPDAADGNGGEPKPAEPAGGGAAG